MNDSIDLKQSTLDVAEYVCNGGGGDGDEDGDEDDVSL